ncbi:MAG: endolytic transglycosylase MltG, partial [Actinobacteria bacterium]
MRRSSRRNAALVVLAVIVVVLVTAGVLAWDRLYRPDYQIAAGKPVEVTIKRGSSTEAIAEQLSKAGVVPNALMFRIKARQAEADGKLKAGAYAFETGAGYEAAIGKLVHGPDIVYYDVVIPEGFTARQVAARFAKRAGVSEDEMLELVLHGAPRFAEKYPYLKGAYNDSLEGYLFPATYRIKKGTSPEP